MRDVIQSVHDPRAGELTLDPSDWEQDRATAHRMLDEMFDWLRDVRQRPAWRPMPENVKMRLREPLPRSGETMSSVYEQFRRDILPFPTGNAHPRFWGWVMANGTVAGMMGDFLAAAMNCHLAGYEQAPTYVERQVVAWLTELVGFPPGSTGLLVSGGTAANLMGLAVARHAKAGFDVRGPGLQASPLPRLRVYGSSETHSWIYKACELMGLGRDAFRAVPANPSWQIDVDKCRSAIAADLARGDRPFCILGTAGTVNTGAVDNLSALRELADEFGLWFHVDGAFGSMAAISDARALVLGQESADSIAFDLHKWGYMQYEIGVALTRHPELNRDTFAGAASYLASAERGISTGATYFADMGLQLSRSFRALKAWFSFKTHGADQIGALISQNIRHCTYLADLIEAEEHLELLAPVTLNVVCFRYVAPDMSDEEANVTNQEILMRLQESGIAVPSQTSLGGRFAIRVCNTNHRSRAEDFDILVGAVVKLGDDVWASGRSKAH